MARVTRREAEARASPGPLCHARATSDLDLAHWAGEADLKPLVDAVWNREKKVRAWKVREEDAKG